MKRFWHIGLFTLICFSVCCNAAYAVREVRDVPLDACIFLGKYDPKAAAWTMSAYEKILRMRSPAFLEVHEVKSLDEAVACDIAIRISQPDTFAVKADIFSTQTKKIVSSVEESGFVLFNPAGKVVVGVMLALQDDTPLGRQMIQQRQLRLAKPAKDKDSESRIASLPEKKEPASLHAIVRSDIDDVPLLNRQQRKNAYAVIIGIENYRQKLPKADFAASDATLVGEYLTKVLGYPEENVISLLNDHAAYADFAKYFEKWLPNNVEKGSTVFVYYSGHGAPDSKTGMAYLVPYDGDPSFIAETGYPLKRMYDALGKLPAKEIVVALDSCFSGAGGRSVVAKGMRPLVMNLQANQILSRNMTVLAASAGEQTSSTYDEKGHGLFTYFLLKGIKNEDVVRPDGSIKLDDLFGYVKTQVERIARKQFNNEQTPQLIGGK